MIIRRRTALALGALAVAGCAPETSAPQLPSPTSSPASPTAPTSSPASPTVPEPGAQRPVEGPVTTPPVATPPVATPSIPTREEIVASFSGQTPTQWGLEVDGVVLRHDNPQVVLTFDACGGPNGSGVDEDLLNVLASTSTPATLFINARWAEANPATLQDLIANPLFEIANHGTRHLPLSVTGEKAYGIPGTTSVAEVYDEVAGVQALLTALVGEAPRFFRSGTAHYDDVAVRVVQALGLTTVNFDINADAGATFTASQVASATAQAREGSICIGHFNRPGSGTAEGIRRAIPQLVDKGLTFAQLGDVLS